jgi:large subunit ribosomal protein L35
MPKKKTRKAVAKRFKRTAKGKIKHSKAGSGHLLSSKSRKRKRKLRGSSLLSKVEAKRVREIL